MNPELERFIDEELKSKGYGVKHVEVSLDALQDDVLNLMIAAKNIIGLMPIKEGVNVFQFMHGIINMMEKVDNEKEQKPVDKEIENINKILDMLKSISEGLKKEDGADNN